MSLKRIACIVGSLLLVPLSILQGFLWNNTSEVDAASNNVAAFGKKVAKKNQMKFLNDGVGTIVSSSVAWDKKAAWDISIMADRAWTIDQARPVVVNIMQEFWDAVSQDPVVLKHMQEVHGNHPGYDPVLTPDRLGLKLAFWDKDVNRPRAPYISQIIVSDGFIKYYTADPKDQSLLPPTTETLEEASQKASLPIIGNR